MGRPSLFSMVAWVSISLLLLSMVWWMLNATSDRHRNGGVCDVVCEPYDGRLTLFDGECYCDMRRRRP